MALKEEDGWISPRSKQIRSYALPRHTEAAEAENKPLAISK